jgi:restriction system protein
MIFFNFGKKDNKPKEHTCLVSNEEKNKIEELSYEESLKRVIEKKIVIIKKTDSYKIRDKYYIALLSSLKEYIEIEKNYDYLEKFLDVLIEKNVVLYEDDIKSKAVRLWLDIVNLISSHLITRKSLEILSKIAELKYRNEEDALGKLLTDNIIEAIFELNEDQYLIKIPYANRKYALKKIIALSKEKNNYHILLSFVLNKELYESFYYGVEYNESDVNEAVALSINEIIKDQALTECIAEIIEFGSHHLSNETRYELTLNFAKKTHNFKYAIEKYGYNDDIVDAIIENSKETNDYSNVMRCLAENWSNREKITKYLLNSGEKTKVIKYLEQNYTKDSVLVPYLEYCVSSDKEQDLKNMIFFIKKSRKYYNYLTIIKKEKVFEILKYLHNLENDIWYFAMILLLETDTILQGYKEVDFLQNPEVNLSLKKLRSGTETNYLKFYAFVKQIIKSGKPNLALFILNEYGGYNLQSDIKLWVDSYVESFVMLKKVDILVKHYMDFIVSSQNIELLQSIAQYYIDEKKPQKAMVVVEDMTKLEPVYPFIQSARYEIERLSMIEELSQTNIDMESINSLSGEDFERILMQKFEELGFKVISTPKTGDFGADIIVDTKNETRFVIQCKRFKNKVNLKAVQEVVGALPHYNGDIGIVITNSGFLSSAIKLAKSNDIELWDNLKLIKFFTGDISFSQLSEL